MGAKEMEATGLWPIKREVGGPFDMKIHL